MPVPQRLTFVTLGARSVPTLREFYRSWGWLENEGSSDEFVSFTSGSVRLALYGADHLRDEAAPGAPLPPVGGWNGITLAINVASRSDVDDAIHEAIAAGALLVAHPVDREWGGYSGYVADPEGHRWEIAWAPGIEPG